MESVRIVFADINGVMKGKLIPKEAFAPDKVYGTPRSVLLQDISGAENYQIDAYSPDSGDSDMRMLPVMDTLCDAPGNRGISQVVCDVVDMNTGDTLPESPRELLKSVITRLDTLGLSAKVAIELEFFITNIDGTMLDAKQLDQPYADVNALYKLEKLINEYLNGTKSVGLVPECVLSETGEGQLEINYGPMSPLEMADRTFMFRQMIKEIALQNGYLATFLAKPFAASSGSGSHVHISLYDGEGNNILLDPAKLDHFLAGQILLTPELYALYAPNPNSYRRIALSEGYVPNTPSYGHDDRKAALRTTGVDQNFRVENRIAGSDVNPYVQIAAALGSGLYGIEHSLRRDNEQVRSASETTFASSLPEAVAVLENSQLAREIITEEFIRAFVAVKQEEWKLFLAHITPWERNTYGPLV